MNNYEAELELAKNTAISAAEYLTSSEVKVESEIGKDIKLVNDVESEKLIISSLMQGSKLAIVSEELNSEIQIKSGEPFWVVDPIDGSFNVKKGIPLSCISIGLWGDDGPILGVVYDFNRKHLYSGLVGHGAFLNDEPIKVACVEDVSSAVIGTGFPVYRDFTDDSLKSFLKRVQSFKKIRMLGTAGLMAVYVSDGKFDAYFEEAIKLWDVAAAAAIVKSAGGCVEVKMHESQPWLTQTKLACNQLIFDAI